MNARERFLALMNFEPVDRGMLWEFGYWGGTIERWYNEGLPRTRGLSKPVGAGETVAGPGLFWPVDSVIRDEDVSAHLGFDAGLCRIPVEPWLFPPFDEVTLDEDAQTITMVNRDGLKIRKRKDDSTIPQYLDWPVKNREDFERLKNERFNPAEQKRFPGNWSELVKTYKYRDYPLVVAGGPFGFFGSLRSLMGEMRLLTAYYDDPGLVKDILEFLTDFWIALWSKVLSDVKADCACFWEDMCYRNSSLVSPAIFREFMSPCYERMTASLQESGVNIILADTDGNCTELIPLFIECGVNGLYPMEVQAGMDVVKVGETFPGLRIWGGLDKRKLAGGADQIEAEVASKVRPMMRRGGYIPFADHLIPPDVSWENFVYYRRCLAEAVGGRCSEISGKS